MTVPASAQKGYDCNTVGQLNSVGCLTALHTANELGPFYIRIYVHVIRKTGGAGGHTTEQVNEALQDYLYPDFKGHNIFFSWDGNINYIDNTGLYNAVGGNSNILSNQQYVHDDGVDLFLFPDDPTPGNSGAGLASGFVASACYTAGNEASFPNASMTRSHVLSHEVGHCLGLFHTHHSTDVFGNPNTGAEYVNGENCEDAGDCICDTPADPNIDLPFNSVTCEWLGSNDSMYTPLTDNIMSYAHLECLDKFTPGQGKRMRNLIATETLLQGFLVKPRNIEVDETWTVANTNNGLETLNKNLVIKDNATLTIEAGVTVCFATNTKLIIEPGSKLILNGTLTACWTNWKGVEVWGNSVDPAPSQYTINGASAQGTLIALPGSVIENAEVGVQLWGPTVHAGAGGIIRCTGTLFKNNTVGVDFVKYENYWPYAGPSPFGQPRDYFATFTDCNFKTTDEYPLDIPFNAFVSMYQVNGPTFYGCNFVNEQATPIPAPTGTLDFFDYGYGIFAFSSKFNILAKCNTSTAPCGSYTRSEFRGLGVAISAGQLDLNDLGEPFIVKQADFYDCYIGIQNRTNTGSTILFNKFHMGNLPDATIEEAQLGIDLSLNIQGFTIEENEFINEFGQVPTIGIACYQLGDRNLSIRRNTFTELDIAIEAAGVNASASNINRGLYLDCNTNSKNTGFDYLVYSDNNANTNDVIREKQGLIVGDIPNIQYFAAGNKFSTTPFTNFSNDGTGDIDYHFLDTPGNNEDPIVIQINKIPTNDANLCTEDFCEPPCRTDQEITQIKQDYYQGKSLYTQAVADYEYYVNINDTTLAEQKAIEAARYRESMDKDAYTVLLHTFYDTLSYHEDTVKIWIRNLDTYTADLKLSGKFFAEGNTSAAIGLLMGIPYNYTLSTNQQADVNQMQQLINTLNGKVIDSLDAVSIAALETIADGDPGYAQGLTRNILTAYYSKQYPPQYTLGQNKSLYQSPGNGKEPLPEKERIRVSPNPARAQVVFASPLFEQWEEGTISILNLNGQIIWQLPIGKDNDQLIWHTGNTPNGIYFYRVSIQGTIKEQGKIIVNK